MIIHNGLEVKKLQDTEVGELFFASINDSGGLATVLKQKENGEMSVLLLGRSKLTIENVIYTNFNIFSYGKEWVLDASHSIHHLKISQNSSSGLYISENGNILLAKKAIGTSTRNQYINIDNFETTDSLPSESVLVAKWSIWRSEADRRDAKAEPLFKFANAASGPVSVPLG